MDIVIVEVEDAGSQLKVTELPDGNIEVNLDVTYNFAISYQKTCYRLNFSREKFEYFQHCLKNGIKSWHGDSSIWQANKIFIQKQNHPNNYRNVRVYRRFFIVGFNIVPVALSQVVVRAILGVKV
ncbi:hypothetical protein [Teredinibacter turnerae]|uniref:hypothetical protein n=1 Tax=Teredinibacter turnerae TaxID=2426 RepID=UPI0005A1C032|nr:hypothetical protein [Teredinibacter turnerae]